MVKRNSFKLFLFYFLYSSEKMAPPITNTAPKICRYVKVSFKNIVEKNIADNGSRYP